LHNFVQITFVFFDFFIITFIYIFIIVFLIIIFELKKEKNYCILRRI